VSDWVLWLASQHMQNALDLLNYFNIPQKRHKKILNLMTKGRLEMLQNNSTPGIDKAVIEVFYAE
jgi:hypothetical protein